MIPDPTSAAWELVRTLPGAPPPATPSALALHPDGRRLFAAGYNHVTVWDIDRGERLDELPLPDTKALVIPPSGDRLVVAGSEAVRVYDLAGREQQALPHGASDPSSRLALHPDGRRLLLYSGAGTFLKVWDLERGALLRAVTELFTSYSGGASEPITADNCYQALAVWEASGGDPYEDFLRWESEMRRNPPGAGCGRHFSRRYQPGRCRSSSRGAGTAT